MSLAQLREILDQRQLTALFQPVVNMQSGNILGYEGLIRGPDGSPLHSPLALFKVAAENGLSVEVEHLCRKFVIEQFASQALPGKLFLNVSPTCLLQPDVKYGETLGYIEQFGINPNQVIIELTEHQPTIDYDVMRQAVTHYRDMGFQIAIDDLGEGFSSLRLWSELRPNYVKIDMHFIHGINCDPIKFQFVKSIQEIAKRCSTIVIAEGIETLAELLLIRDIGVACGQGYLVARPTRFPPQELPADVRDTLGFQGVAVYPTEKVSARKNLTAQKLLQTVTPVPPGMTNNQLYEYLIQNPGLESIPVVNQGSPVGIIARTTLIAHFARPFTRELNGNKSCTMYMDKNPLIFDKNTPLQELSLTVIDAAKHHLTNGFIITERNQYIGIGTGHDLIREITNLQINAARYANPLTLLPGNVPINEHIDRLLDNGALFFVCYIDLDSFKPYNDTYGYHKGDDVLAMTGNILQAHCDADRDFLGHIGGDDFLILFQSEDWEARCNAILADFAATIVRHYHREDLKRGTCQSEDRRGNLVAHPLVTISLGVVKAEPGHYHSHHQIATAATEMKKMAKKMPGNSLAVERRTGPYVNHSVPLAPMNAVNYG